MLNAVLAFDCSGASCSAAVWVDGAIRAAEFAEMERGQAETLMPQIQRVMRAAAIGFDRLEALTSPVGPGSFTGLRIGLAAARGLALAAARPIIAVTAFEAVLAGLDETRRRGRAVAVLIDSRRGPVFAQAFDAAGHVLGEPAALEPEAVESWLPPGPVALAGDGTPALAGLITRRDVLLPDQPDRIRADRLGAAVASWGLGAIGRRPALPLYLRAPDVTMPRAAP